VSGTLDVGGHGKKAIGRQISLPFSKAFEVAWKGIKIRIWRSLITMSGIILAIAFLMSVWTSSVFTQAMQNVPPDHKLYPLVQGVLEAKALAGGGVSIVCAVAERPQPDSSVTPGAAIRHALEGAQGFRGELLPPDPNTVVSMLTQEQAYRPDAFIIVGFPDVLNGPGVGEAVSRFVKEGGFLLVYGTADLQNAEVLADVLPATPGSGVSEVDGAQITAGEQLTAARVMWRTHPTAEFVHTEGKPGAEALATVGGQALVWTWEVAAGKAAWYTVTEAAAEHPDVLSWFVRGRQVATAGQGDARSALLVQLLAYGSREKLGAASRDMRGIGRHHQCHADERDGAVSRDRHHEVPRGAGHFRGQAVPHRVGTAGRGRQYCGRPHWLPAGVRPRDVHLPRHRPGDGGELLAGDALLPRGASVGVDARSAGGGHRAERGGCGLPGHPGRPHAARAGDARGRVEAISAADPCGCIE